MKEIDTNTKQPLVSVIMPTYNHARFIGEAIDSVLNQTYKNLELIIIDNYSKDNTEEIVASYRDDRIKYLKFRNNGIIAASRNYGIKHSQGEYIAFLDSDDKWNKKKLEKQIPHFQSSKIVGVASDAILIADTPYYRQKNYGRSKLGYIDYQYIDILNSNPVMTSSCIVKRNIIENVGFFDENRDFCFIEDWELWLRMARFGKFRVLEQQLLVYRVLCYQGRDKVEVSKKIFKIFEKQLELRYVRDEDVKEPRARNNISIANKLLELDDPTCREYYFNAIQDSSVFKIKMKAFIGYFLSLLPKLLRDTVRFILYKTDWIISFSLDQIWKIRKLIYK